MIHSDLWKKIEDKATFPDDGIAPVYIDLETLKEILEKWFDDKIPY